VTIREALRRGIQKLSRAKRVCLIFYAATTAAALLITAPAMMIAFDSLGDSAWAREMNGNLDLTWVSELASSHGATPWMPMLAILIGTSAISMVVYLFLLGGALQVLSTGDPLFAGCGRNFWRMVRLALISTFFYGAAFLVYNRLGFIGRKIWGEGSEATPLIHWGWFRAAVLLCLLGLVNLVFDYARVRLVADDQRKTLRATIAAFRFVWKNLPSTLGLYAIVCAIAGLIFAAYLGVSHSLAQTSLGLVLILLLVRQGMVLAKVWSRLLFYSTACELYGARKPAQPIVMEPKPEPVPETETLLEPEAATEAKCEPDIEPETEAPHPGESTE
jgi:hypothetical protein